MSGLAPLTYGTLADFSRLTRTPLDPEDVEALFVLDAVMSHPDEPKKAGKHG